MIESIKRFFFRILDFIRNLFKKSEDSNTEQQIETILEIEADDDIILDITDIILIF